MNQGQMRCINIMCPWNLRQFSYTLGVKCNKIARDQGWEEHGIPTIKDVLRHNTVFERNPESDVGRVKSSKLDLEWTGARTRGRMISQETIAKSWVQDEIYSTQAARTGTEKHTGKLSLTLDKRSGFLLCSIALALYCLRSRVLTLQRAFITWQNVSSSRAKIKLFFSAPHTISGMWRVFSIYKH